METVLATVRASSWPSLFDCSQRWYWQNIVGLRSPPSGAAAVGTAIHAGTAVFDAAPLEGRSQDIDEAMDAAASTMQEKIAEGADFEDGPLTQKSAVDVSVLLTARYCQQIAPTRRYAAVELECRALDIATEYGIVRITGTTDRIRIADNGEKGISDMKSGARATKKTEDGGRCAATEGHHIQMGVYTLMAEQASGERLDAPAEIIGLQTTKDAPVATGYIADVKTPLLGDGEHPGLIEIAAHMIKAGIFPPNPKSILCSKKYCPAHASHCHYHG
jgi:hypothetical protein